MFILTAFILGLAGSLHCIGMCGPIALALPVKRQEWRIWSVLIYNIGRVSTYMLLGVIVGFIGKGFAVAGIQQKISIAIGISILLSLLLPNTLLKHLRPNNAIYRCVTFLKGRLSDLFKSKSYFSLFSIGVLNGLLPCGFVYIALAGATINSSIGISILYMALFGLGTIPLMASISYLPHLISVSARTIMRKALPVLTFLFAVLFIVRGLNLGIPYLSPEFNNAEPMQVKCCRK